MSELKTCLDETGLKIVGKLYRAVAQSMGDQQDPCLLAAIGSWGDTLDDTDVLDAINNWLEMGECFSPSVSVKL